LTYEERPRHSKKTWSLRCSKNATPHDNCDHDDGELRLADQSVAFNLRHDTKRSDHDRSGMRSVLITPFHNVTLHNKSIIIMKSSSM
jgi:hypothetical protein